MEVEIINVPEGKAYLGQFLNELPVNCLFDKGRTGCGGTNLAIENDKDTIIAMPYVALIKNKISQHGDIILGVHGETTSEEITDYIMKVGKKKIAVTYDSLERLVTVLSDNGINVFERFFLLVDEWHVLFNSYVFRNKAVKKVLSLARNFNEVTYMTATPVEEEFILEELKNIPVKQVQWGNTVNVSVYPIMTNNPCKKVCSIVKDAIEGRILGNLHFFVNSVDFIAKVLEESDLQPDSVRVICSQNDKPGKGKKKNQTKLGENYPIKDTTSLVKKINFYTSSCFEGCDIYDVNGRTYIVSDGNKAHTLMDISTLFVQICGRIRNSNYNMGITHIFTETRYSGNITLDEYIEKSNQQLNEAEGLVNEINNMSDNNRKKTIAMIEKGNKGGLNEQYIFNVDNKLELDKNLVKVDIMNFKISKHLYKSRIVLMQEYANNGFKVNDCQEIIYTDKLAHNPKAKISFKDLFLEYAEIRDAQKGLIHFGSIEDRQSLIEREKPLIKEAYDNLGSEKVKSLNFNITNIKRELLKQSDTTPDYKVYKSLRDAGIRETTEIPTSKLRELLKSIYQTFGKKKAAKATDIGIWFDFRKVTRKIDGKSIEYVLIIKEKIVYE